MRHRIPSSFVDAGMTLLMRSGLDTERVVRETGLSPLALRPGGDGVSDEQAIRLVHTICRMTDDDLLGLGRAPVPRGTLRLLCYAMASVSTLGEALERYPQLIRSIPGIPGVELITDGPRCALTLEPLTDDGPDHILTLVCVAALDRVIGWAIGRPVPLLGVELPFAEPYNATDIAVLLGPRVRYDSSAGALVFPSSLLSAPVSHNEQSLLEYLATIPARLLVRGRDPLALSEQVRRMMEKNLRRRYVPSAEDVAAALLISTPTLRRNLRDEGTSLRTIRDEVLRAAAITALRTTDDSIYSISEQLCFSEASAFTRAFRRWTGVSPDRFRTSELANPAECRDFAV